MSLTVHRMQRLSFALGGLTVLSLAVPTPSGEGLAYAPPTDETLTKRVEWGTRLTTEQFELDLGGRVMNQGVGLERETTYTLEAEDRVLAHAEGRAGDLRRHFLELVREVEANDPAGDGTLQVAGLGRTTSPLQGHTVRFLWDEEAEEHGVSWDEDDVGGGDDAWLEVLDEDLDLCAFLPGDTPEVGDRWTVEADAIAFLLGPGGDLRLEAERERDDDRPEGAVHIEVPSARLGAYPEGLEGSIDCQFLELVEDDGRRLAVVRVRAELRAEDDLADAMAEADPDGQQYDLAKRSVSFLGEGDLRWDLDRQHAVAFDFEAELEQGLSSEWTMDLMGQDTLCTLETAERGTAFYRFRQE